MGPRPQRHRHCIPPHRGTGIARDPRRCDGLGPGRRDRPSWRVDGVPGGDGPERHHCAMGEAAGIGSAGVREIRVRCGIPSGPCQAGTDAQESRLVTAARVVDQVGEHCGNADGERD